MHTTDTDGNDYGIFQVDNISPFITKESIRYAGFVQKFCPIGIGGSTDLVVLVPRNEIHIVRVSLSRRQEGRKKSLTYV